MSRPRIPTGSFGARTTPIAILALSVMLLPGCVDDAPPGAESAEQRVKTAQRVHRREKVEAETQLVSREKLSLYATKEAKDAIPQLARELDPDMMARKASISSSQSTGHFLASPHGSAYAVDNDQEDVWSGLTGTEIGEVYGGGGLGLVGTGGGGTAGRTIGLGNIGRIGKGGAGSGYGRGSGVGFGARGKRVPRVRMDKMTIGAPTISERKAGKRRTMKRKTDSRTTSRENVTINVRQRSHARGHQQHSVASEGYDRIEDNALKQVADDPRSTFSIDVDTASYANVRRFLNRGSRPPPDAVRIEEMINYFDYAYAPPDGSVPFSVTAEVGPCPWNPERNLLHLGLKGKVIAPDELPPRNLVFLLDVSGSMRASTKLPLVKRALRLLTESLTEDDRVSIVVYAGESGLVLSGADGSDKQTILAAVDRLSAGGSTNAGQGIQLAYRTARESFIKGGINRVVLATDGDFNVGVTSRSELIRLVEREREGGTFLSVLGFGTGNLKDSQIEQIANKGNGNYAYIDSVREARKVLVEEAGGTLVTIAKDVKIQVEFNPAAVSAFRLVGYENRVLAHRDFNDDRKDAGEIGAGHTVTAMYEIVPARGQAARPDVDPLRYQHGSLPTAAAASDELMTMKIRYKAPGGGRSRLLELPLSAETLALDETSDDFRFSAAVAELGMLLRHGELEDASYGEVLSLASGARGRDAHGYRAEFIKLVASAARLAGETLRASTEVARRPAPASAKNNRISITDPRPGRRAVVMGAAAPGAFLTRVVAMWRSAPDLLKLMPSFTMFPLLALLLVRRRRT